MIVTLFWISIFILFYTYVGYGLIILMMVALKRMLYAEELKDTKGYFPEVTLVIPAYNEEDFISTKVENTLNLAYPQNRLKIIFITDGSTDRTTEILNGFDGITVLHQDQRGGKSAALNRAMRFVNSEIVIFNDANTLLEKHAVMKMAQSFSSPKVGGVSGEKTVIIQKEDGTSAHGEGLYWKYESFLKEKDAQLHSVMGAAGELIAFRTALVEDLEHDVILDDFMMTFSVINKGFKVAYLPEVKAIETASANVEEELKRKKRIAAGGWQAMSRLTELLKFWKTPLISFMYISHRVLRWSLSAFLLPLAFLLNALILDQGAIYIGLFIGQLLFYGLAAIGHAQRYAQKPAKVFFIPYYFVIMNYAVYAGFMKHIQGKQSAIWERSLRSA